MWRAQVLSSAQNRERARSIKNRAWLHSNRRTRILGHVVLKNWRVFFLPDISCQSETDCDRAETGMVKTEQKKETEKREVGGGAGTT